MSSYAIAERINSDVNASVQYKTDLEQYDKPEFWVEANTLTAQAIKMKRDVKIFSIKNGVSVL